MLIVSFQDHACARILREEKNTTPTRPTTLKAAI
jgi:hypothetical protein